jgi:hypothetical protein
MDDNTESKQGGKMTRQKYRENIIDVSDPNHLMLYGQFLYKYPDICPFCFSKYPEDRIKKTEHIIRCNRMARGIREGLPTAHFIPERTEVFYAGETDER